MRRRLALLTLWSVLTMVLGTPAGARIMDAGIQGTQISEDPYTNPNSRHKTQVGADTFAFRNTIVAVFQTGVFLDRGATNIGWATSRDGGNTWTNGFLPGTTQWASPPGDYSRVSDPAVAFDPKHNVWMISIVASWGEPPVINNIITSRSTDGGLTWRNPVVVAFGPGNSFYDKSWVACDTTPSSPFYGNCYAQWSDIAEGNLMLMSTSTNGGLSWGPPKSPPSNERDAIGGQPVVMASGKVVVPFIGNNEIKVFSSSDGGNNWSVPTVISNLDYHFPAGDIRADRPFPSAEVRIPGPIVVVWPDCRFQPNCNANDLVMVTSPDGTNWSSVKRIPLDPIGSGVDHFIASVAIQQPTTTSSLLPRLAVGYYYYPQSLCSFDTCRLFVGFSFSANFGATWTEPQTLAGPMQIRWLPQVGRGFMVGDYMSTSYIGTNAFPVYAEAFMSNPPSEYLEHMFTTKLPA